MSLKGQWVGQYSGTNSGTAVLDLDEFEDYFAGTAVAWDNHPQKAASLVRLRTPSKANTHHFQSVPLEHLDKLGKTLTQAEIQQLAANGLMLPATADIDIDLKGQTLSLRWNSSIGTSGAGAANAPKTRAGQPSNILPQQVKGWEGFKKTVNRLGQKRFIYRGQGNNAWRLRTSFHRSGRSDLDRYGRDDIGDLNRTFSALTQHPFNLSDSLHYAAFINLEGVMHFASVLRRA